MPWYVRFAKVPKIIPSKSAQSPPSLSFSFEIRNDLGDTLYPVPTTIVATISHSNLPTSPVKHQHTWDGRKWTENVKIPFPSRSFALRPGVISVNLEVQQPKGESNKVVVSGCQDLQHIYGTTSASFPIAPKSKAPPFALRRLPGGLEIWEETGSSIAAHVWDAGVVLCAHLCFLAGENKAFSDHIDDGSHVPSQSTSPQSLAAVLVPGEARVLELGTGCGTSGLVLAQQFPSTHIELTDTADAQELIDKNVALVTQRLALEAKDRTQSSTEPETQETQPQEDAALEPNQTVDVAAQVQVQARALDWESVEDLTAAANWVSNRDLVLVSDCTYNVDMIEHLVKALRAVANSDKCLVAVALKRRHEDEEKFFGEMDQGGFVHLRKHAFVILCTQEEERYGLEAKEIELHLYRVRAE